ncbi:chaperonin 10-like protein [Boeremia exigua]|uniref:chaperonin 10-like protein n=1 Tax=Boeremia exigua TaxID=749465 RepID=UPI001E8E4967|nr:chaperonin 10-like protein [Boeremia exigua]KAH6633108.1 chaperonin 10-like protein [Boeremia exigua]
MNAFRFCDVASGLQQETLPIPKPSSSEALIRVEAAGLCHSDTHVLHGGGAAWMCKLPITLGHEIAGVIIELGGHSPSLKIGDSVAVACVGHPIETRDFSEALGVGRDGGYAQYVVAPLKNLVPIPAGVSFAQAAVATDSVATAYHAIVSEGGIGPSSTVGIIGMGGLGLNGVAIAAARKARVYGIDIDETKFELAQSLGAVACASNLSVFSDQTFDVIVDFAGAQATIESAMAAVRPGGTVVLVGLASDKLTFTTTELVTKNIALRGSTSASMEELQDVLHLIGKGILKPQIEWLPFSDIPNGLKRLGTQQVQGRLYATPNAKE